MKKTHPNSGTVIQPRTQRPLSAKTRERLADSKARPVPMQALNPRHVPQGRTGGSPAAKGR